MKRKILLFLFFLLGHTKMFGQQKEMFRHFNVQMGLSQATVKCILQDSRGFIWFGTEDGLNRFNAYSVDVYKHEPSDNGTISHSNIRCIFESHDSLLWVGTDEGLNYYDRSTEKFTHYKNIPGNENSLSSNLITAIAEDDKGRLWIGTAGAGISVYDHIHNKFIHYNSKNSSLSNNSISCIIRSSDNKLWIGTADGVNIFDASEKFSVIKNNIGSAVSLSENEITCLMEDHEKNIWIGTLNNGLNKLNKELNKVTYYNEENKSIAQNTVFSIAEDNNGFIWVGTIGGGLNKLDLNHNSNSIFKNDPLNSSSISNNDIWSLYYDKTGTLWIGSRNGVDIYNDAILRFKTISVSPANPSLQNNTHVYSIYQDREKTLWVGLLAGGLVSTDESGKKNFYVNDPGKNSLSNNSVFAICEDSKGILWFGTYDGLNSFDKKTGIFKVYKNNPADKNSLSNNYVKSIFEDSKGILWIGTFGGGLNEFDRNTEKFISYHYKNQEGSSLSNDIVTSIMEDKQSNLWIGTYGGGLCLFNRSTKSFQSFQYDPENNQSISNNFIQCLAIDKNGLLWVGTYGGGINAFHMDSKQAIRYTERDGLSNNVVNGILIDDKNYLWISTNKGLSKLIQNNNSKVDFRVYDYNDGLNNQFIGGAFCYGDNGNFYFAGEEGYNVFHPGNIQDNPYLPPVVITKFYLFEKPFYMDTIVTSKSVIRLTYKQNYFLFEFSALNYVFPEKNKYAYMMDGLDKDWNYIGTRRTAQFTDIDPGTYTFRVKACNNDGVWNETGTYLTFIITPPFYKTWWFYVLCAVVFAAATLLYIRLRTKAILRQYEILEKKVDERTDQLKKEKEKSEQKTVELGKAIKELSDAQEQLIQSEKMASLGQLTAGIAHEIQNPLNFVNNFSELSIELLHEMESVPPNEQEIIVNDLISNLQKINHHGKRADSIVKGMLMHSRQGNPDKQSTDINLFVEESYNLAYHGKKATLSSFNCSVNKTMEKNLPEVKIVQQNFSRVLINLFNNAFDAMMEKTEKMKNETSIQYSPVLNISTEKYQNKIILKIRDNGNGIPDDVKDKIFNPFFTTKSTGKGTGLGLSISYDIVTKEHNGEIVVNSKLGEFTEFIISLPI